MIQTQHDIFIALKTPASLLLANDWIGEFAEQSPFYGFQMLGFKKDMLTWDDGFVLRIAADETPYEIAKACAGALGRLPAWAIFSSTHDVVEFPPWGPIGRFFESAAVKSSQGDLTQIFLMGEHDSRHYNVAVESIKEAMKGPCSTIFDFRDGQIILLWTKEPGSITAQRIARQGNRLEGWIVADAGGNRYSSAGVEADIWEAVDIDELQFVADDDESEAA